MKLRSNLTTMILLLCVSALLATGCVATARPALRHSHEPAHGQVVVVKKGHQHSDRCGHYRHQGRWYYAEGHTHRAGCGHAHVKGVWAVRR